MRAGVSLFGLIKSHIDSILPKLEGNENAGAKDSQGNPEQGWHQRHP
jgi:hypothetical protein